MTSSDGENLAELREKTTPHLHETAFRIFAGLLKPPARVLDLGAGSGAWLSRLIAAGFEGVSVEKEAEEFILPGTRNIPADLNSNFADRLNGLFQAITLIEVLEHLENPRQILRQCQNLLAPGGFVLITTPNIECVAGRLRFLRSGHFRMFDRDETCNDPTHISPLQTLMFERMVRDTGFSIRLHTYNDPAPEISRRLSRLICWLVEPLLSGQKGRDNHIYVLQRSS